VPDIFTRFKTNSGFLTHFNGSPPVPNFKEIYRAREAPICAEGQTDMKKLTGVFRDYANVPNKNQYGIICMTKWLCEFMCINILIGEAANSFMLKDYTINKSRILYQVIKFSLNQRTPGVYEIGVIFWVWSSITSADNSRATVRIIIKRC